MSISERNVEVLPNNSPGRSQFRRPGEIKELLLDQHWHIEPGHKPDVRKKQRDRSYMPLLFCLLIAIVVRVWLVIHTQGFIDGDEALVGIQAQHILRGEFPIYYYNQPYMGSLEAYLMAAIFAIMGSSVWTLRAEPILISLVVVWLTWKMAGILADIAHLPPNAKRWFMIIAALLAAVPPLYDTVLELRTLGGYGEIFVLMLLLMISALQLTRRRHAGATAREMAWRWSGIGFIVGLGFWVNPLIISAVIAAALWIFWDYIRPGKRIKGNGSLADLPTQRLATIAGGQPLAYQRTGFMGNLAMQRPTASMEERLPGSRSIALAPLASRRSGAPLAMPGSVDTMLSLVDTIPIAIMSSLRTRSVPKLALLLPIPAALVGCMLGLAPALLWGATHQWQNFTYLFQLSGAPHLRPEVQAQYPTRLSIAFGLTQLYTTCVAPRVVGGALPGESPLLTFLHTPMLILGTSCIIFTILLITLSLGVRGHSRLREHQSLLLSIRSLAALPLVFGACSAFLFCATTAASIGLWSCQYDLAGRYATPLMLVLPFFFASIFAAVILFESNIGASKSKYKTRGTQRDSVLTSIFTSFRRLTAPLTIVFRTQAILGILAGLFLLSLYMQVFSYGLTDADSTFQSPYCTYVPANNDQIIAYLQQEHIHYAWANNWLAYSIVFKSHGNIIVADPLPLIRQIPTLNRIPANTNAILQADRPSIITVVKQNDRYPLLEMILDLKNVTYHLARFHSVQGTDVLVITPLSRTVSPLEVGDFYDVFNCARDS